MPGCGRLHRDGLGCIVSTLIEPVSRRPRTWSPAPRLAIGINLAGSAALVGAGCLAFGHRAPSIRQTLAMLARFRGAKRGANAGRRQATSGDNQPWFAQLASPIRPHSATCSDAAYAPEKRKVGGSIPPLTTTLDPTYGPVTCKDAPEPMPAPGTPSDRDDPLVTVVRCTVVHAGCTSLRRLKAATYALGACHVRCSRGSKPALASCSQVAAGRAWPTILDVSPEHLIRREIQAHPLPAHTPGELGRCCSAMRSKWRR